MDVDQYVLAHAYVDLMLHLPIGCAEHREQWIDGVLRLELAERRGGEGAQLRILRREPGERGLARARIVDLHQRGHALAACFAVRELRDVLGELRDSIARARFAEQERRPRDEFMVLVPETIEQQKSHGR